MLQTYYFKGSTYMGDKKKHMREEMVVLGVGFTCSSDTYNNIIALNSYGWTQPAS